jgi:hypothetical protein
MEADQVDEIVYGSQDALSFECEAMLDDWDSAKENPIMEKYRKEVVPAIPGEIESRLTMRGGQFLVGNMFSLADLLQL